MTIRETLHKYLTDRGLWPQEADAVIDAYRDHDTTPDDMTRRMNDDTEGYPPQMMPVLIMCVKAEAVRWIDANKPKHFARAAFTDPQPPRGET